MADTLEQLQASITSQYLIERELGRGGMATVFLAKDVRHDREVAVKVLHPELAATIGSERFEREIKLAAKLQHPHILGLYDSGAANGLLYYVMPYVQGESLRDRLNREGQLSVDDALQITLEVADALGYAHAQGIVHRDIKPENIMLANGHALVADFGIARAATEGGAQKLTQTGMALGTPVYMSPEQSTGENVGPGADLYSLGCVLFEMLAGEPPFTGKNSMAIMARHAMDQVPSVRIVRPAVPEEVEEAIYHSMEKAPADRPKTAAEFAAILGMPLGATATRRVTSRYTATRRVLTPATPEVHRPWWKTPWAAVGTTLFVVAGVLAAWKVSTGNRQSAAQLGAAGGPPATKLAVLYLADSTRDKQLGFLADGLTESLIDELSQQRKLDVTSREGVARYRGTTIARDSIGRALGVGTVIDGVVESAGKDSVRVTVVLADGPSGAEWERKTFLAAVADPLAMRTNLVSQAAGLLRSKLGELVETRAIREGTKNPQAWSLVQRAANVRKDADQLARDTNTAPALARYAQADSLLVGATQLDPAWSEPLTLRAYLAYSRSQISKALEAGAVIDSGIAFATRAMELSQNDAAAYEIRGTLRWRKVTRGLTTQPGETERLVGEAETDLQRAVQLDESRANAWVRLSEVDYRKYAVSDAYAHALQAYKADAFLTAASDVLLRLFSASYDLENFIPASQWCDTGRQRFPKDWRFARCQLIAMSTPVANADVNRAWQLVDTVVALSPPNLKEINRSYSQMFVAVVIGRAKMIDSAKNVMVRARPTREVDARGEMQGLEAMARVTIGDKEEAFALLDRYLSANPEHRPGFGKLNSWWWRPLKSDPRYAKLAGPGR